MSTKTDEKTRTTDEQAEPHIRLIWDQIDTLNEDQQLEQLEALATSAIYHLGAPKVLESIGSVIAAWFEETHKSQRDTLRQRLEILRASVSVGKEKLSTDKGQALLLAVIDDIADELGWKITPDHLPPGEGLDFYNELRAKSGAEA